MTYYEKHIAFLQPDYREDLSRRWNSDGLPLGCWPVWMLLVPFVWLFWVMQKLGQKTARVTSRIGYYWRLPGAFIMIQTDKIFKRINF